MANARSQLAESLASASVAVSTAGVPAVATTNSDGGGHDWWQLDVTVALPQITDGLTPEERQAAAQEQELRWGGTMTRSAAPLPEGQPSIDISISLVT